MNERTKHISVEPNFLEKKKDLKIKPIANTMPNQVPSTNRNRSLNANKNNCKQVLMKILTENNGSTASKPFNG